MYLFQASDDFKIEEQSLEKESASKMHLFFTFFREDNKVCD